MFVPAQERKYKSDQNLISVDEPAHVGSAHQKKLVGRSAATQYSTDDPRIWIILSKVVC